MLGPSVIAAAAIPKKNPAVVIFNKLNNGAALVGEVEGYNDNGLIYVKKYQEVCSLIRLPTQYYADNNKFTCYADDALEEVLFVNKGLYIRELIDKLEKFTGFYLINGEKLRGYIKNKIYYLLVGSLVLLPY